MSWSNFARLKTGSPKMKSRTIELGDEKGLGPRDSNLRIKKNGSILMRLAQHIFVAMLTISSVSCVPGTRMERAVITEVDGLPCFSVPNNKETRKGVPLFTLVVSKRNAPGADALPEAVWIFRVEPMGKSIVWKPENCIRYGVTPAGAEQELLIALQPHSIYALALQAVPEDSNLRGYVGDFCMIPGANGRLRLQVIPWDEQANQSRNDVCAPTSR
jgi:hypothetical protein